MAAWYDAERASVCVDLASLCDFVLRAGDLAPHGGIGTVGGNIFSHAQNGTVPEGEGVFQTTRGDVTLWCEPESVSRTETFAKITVIRCVPYSLGYVRGVELEAGSIYALCCAALVMETLGIRDGEVKLIYTRERSTSTKVFACRADRLTAEAVLTRVLNAFAPFADRISERGKALPSELKALKFPYGETRGGQRDFMYSVLRAIKTHTRLVAEAPTGIGKTMAALYPSVKALGEGYADKIFCLTSKGTNANSEEAAARRLIASAPHLRAMTIQSRDGTFRTSACAGRKEGSRCRLADCPIGEGHNARMNGALLELLRAEGYHSRERILQTAEKYSLCPYELSLELAEWCDIVLCDYSYLFDRGVYLRRFFESPDARYVFLIDEAHNLPSRASDMYSAKLVSSAFADVLARRGDSPELQATCPPILELFEELKDRSLAEKRTQENGVDHGFVIIEDVPGTTADRLREFIKASNAYFDSGVEDPTLSDLSFEVRRFLNVLAYFDKRFSMYVETVGDEVTWRILCLDPSELLSESMRAGISSVLFSATLSPLDYYADLLGCSKAKTLQLDSVYESSHLCIVGFDGVSTRYEDRSKRGAVALVNIIRTVIAGKKGKYIVYFPSYQYMADVCNVFVKKYPEMPVIVQKKGMSLRSRNEFISAFSSSDAESLLGFCVLGGSFSEGVDLKGESLIGVIVIGVGFPSISNELNLARDYFDRTRECGMEYAYIYPGMNKVMQAVGRVIRDERDRGIAVIVDDRFSLPPYTTLIPDYWHGIKYTSNLKSLLEVLRDFWREEKS